jgi:CheY-like chemotaxis protein
MAMLAARTARPEKRVLIVDDDAAIVRVLRDALGVFRHEHAYKVETAGDGAEGLAVLKRDQFDLVLLDMNMPRMSGLELLAEMRRLGIQTPVLMLTGNEDNRTAADALAGGILAYIPKPFELQHLELLVSLAASPRTTTVAA